MAKKRAHTRLPKAPSEIVTKGVLDIDEAAEVIPFNYSITAYGSDPPVDGLIKRLREDEILIPLFSLNRRDADVRFQREFVWKKQQADRFVESLLLGLPVPGIFLMKEESGRHLVLDGHQRLQTLRRFCDNDWDGEPFELEHVQTRFRGRTYEDLDPADKRRLDNSIIHATIIRQDEPSPDLSSIYLIFERLNSGGTALQPQEIRVALYHGPFVELLTSLNEFKPWRTLFGRKSNRLKDQELILRFFALLESGRRYSRPMKGFLSSYMARRRNMSPALQKTFRTLFEATCSSILDAIGKKAFKPRAAVNAALVDALMVGVAKRIEGKGVIKDTRGLRAAYRKLLAEESFQGAIARATADEESVKLRLRHAAAAFSRVR